MLQGMDFFCHLQTSPPFARPFRRPLTPVFPWTGTSPSVPPVCAPNPILEPPVPPSARTGLSPALSFIRPERQTQTSPMHKQHFLYSFVPSPANGTTPFLPATPNILSKGSLLLSFSPSLLLPATAFRSLFTSFYHKHLPADVSSLNRFKPQMPVSKTSPALRPTCVSSSAR